MTQGCQQGETYIIGIWDPTTESCRAAGGATHGSAALRRRTKYSDEGSFPLRRLSVVPEPRPTRVLRLLRLFRFPLAAYENNNSSAGSITRWNLGFSATSGYSNILPS
jgi:hypothetical protein